EIIADIERAGGTISGYKSFFICEGLRIVAFVCDGEGRHPETEKIRKIVDWPACRSVTEARAFIGLCVYYRAWIKGFSVVAEPIFRLFRHGELRSESQRNPAKAKVKKENEAGKRKRRLVKEVDFVWGPAQVEAMEKLKKALISAKALNPLVYAPEEDDSV